MVRKKQEQVVSILERGDIFFFYRPLSRYGGKILQSSLTKEAERPLQQALEAERAAHPEGA